MSKELVRFGDVCLDENENYLDSFSNKETNIRTNETNLDCGLTKLDKEHRQLEIDLERKQTDKSKHLSALVKSQQELINLKSGYDKEKNECAIEERKYLQTDENLKSMKKAFDEKQQALKASQANMKNFKLNEFTASHEISIGLKEANAEFQKTLRILVGKTDENILKFLMAEKDALEEELNGYENDEESVATIAEEQSIEFHEEDGDICLKIELLKLIYNDEIKLNQDQIAAERKNVH